MVPQIHQTMVDMHGKGVVWHAWKGRILYNDGRHARKGVVWHDWKRILYKSLSTGAKEKNHSISIKKKT